MKPKILIVDDRPQNLLALKKVLEELDLKIEAATSGQEALFLTLKHDFAVAVVDVQMPEMDGYELVELLRGNYKTERLPVIFVSAIYSDKVYHLKGYDVGAVDFLSKPFIPEILLSKVQVFLDLYQQRIELEVLVNRLDSQNKALEKEIEQRHHAEVALREANEALSKHTIRLEATSLVGRHATSILDVDKLLIEVVKLIQAKFEYYFVGIWSLTERKEADDFIKEELVLQAGVGLNGQQFEHGVRVTMDTPNSIIVQATQTERSYVVDDVRTGPNYLASDKLQAARSELVLPLSIGKRIIGVLDIISDQVAAFSPEDETVLQILADQVAIAVRNAQLYESERKLRQFEANRARDLAELNASKDKFFSIVAHDLRGPFTPVLGNAQLLMEMWEHFSQEETQRMLEDIHRSGKQILALLENLLQWARLQMGRMDYSPQRVELRGMVEQTTELLASNAASKDITLLNEIPLTMLVKADMHMLDMIIRNLASNALKFTRQGGKVTISAFVVPKSSDTTNGDFVEISVSDTGVGISRENISKLFKIGINHSTSGTAHEKGTGLGLIMCKEMIEIHDGRIWVESDLGKGTTVKFTVPVGE
jgi:signal transduction histidine kinase